MGLGALLLPLRNPSFMLIPGAIHLLLLWTGQFSIRTLEGGTRGPFPEAVRTFGLGDLLVGLRGPVSVAVLGVMGMLLIAFAKPPAGWRARRAAKVVMGLAHGALQLAAVVGVAWVSVEIASRVANGALLTVALLALVAVLGGLAGGLAMGAYLAACNVIPGLDTHGNEAFSARRLTGCKNFVRIHIDHEGLLSLYPIGVERAATQWRLDPDGEPSASWLAPDGGAPRPHLIEGPIVIDGRERQ